jgi:nucleoid-associated protein YgaU
VVAPAAGRAPGGAEFFEYLVRRGDTLPRLAERFLGDAERWPDIYALNESRLYSPHVLPVGTALRIPRR